MNMRLLLIILMLSMIACVQDKKPVPLPEEQSPTLNDALEYTGLKFHVLYELFDPSDGNQVLFKLVADSTVLEYKNINYASRTTCLYWAGGEFAKPSVCMRAKSGSFEVMNDTITGLGDTILDYYFINRVAVQDTICISKDDTGGLHLTSKEYNVIFHRK